MRGKIFRSLAKQTASGFELFVGERGIKAGDNDVGFFDSFGTAVENVHAFGAIFFDEFIGGYHINALACAESLQKRECHVARGHNFVGGGLVAKAL